MGGDARRGLHKEYPGIRGHYGMEPRPINVRSFGRPGPDKRHLPAALRRKLIAHHAKRVLFQLSFKPVGQVPATQRDLWLEAELKELDRYELLILDDMGYCQQSREAMEVLLTKLAVCAFVRGQIALSAGEYLVAA